ncbi:hypothetical protein NA56DRAFT_642376 [Hyaloscypha hepaticicola]|uniref:Uncharacterized protein n=1 Tax=Hyaloscypha hepaticicola TaxID=2082293 RepID=A0A2J6QGE5_9HELO|nr:hypothetical protein NA56DRAFT_642376 [Hyaloscypha hepaticicola]
MAESSSSMGPRAEPTPPSSHHPDNVSPTSPPGYPAPDTPPNTNMDTGSQEQVITCMYILNCDTGSQLRKAISHIFGRNKMCTRLIPQHIWVHYCRKHYQRSRYRNPKEYAKLQCDLVQKQIRAIREWSNDNIEKGAAGVVIDWGLAVRKREQKRLDDLNANGRKRTASAAFDHDDEDGEGGRGIAAPATAVPTWLLQQCGKGYTTDEILGIFSRLHTAILNDEMPCFPDIEILPNIVFDEDQPKSPKGYTKRSSATGHKRSQSLSANTKSDYHTGDRRMSHSGGMGMNQPGVMGQDTFQYGSSTQKRHRPNEMGSMDFQGHLPPFQQTRMSQRPVESGRRTHQLAHRPMHPSIGENEEGYGAHAYQHPLPAPTPQRLGGQSMASHLENTNEYAYGGARRSMHQRSHSDMSFARPSAFSPAPSMHSSAQEHRGQFGRDTSSPYASAQVQPAMSYADHRINHVARPHGHSRHQSTPMAHQTYQSRSYEPSQPSTPGYGYAQGNNTLPPPASGPRITESPQVQALYSSRR